MATAVACPTCGVDGTDAANAQISRALAGPPPLPPRGLRIQAGAPSVRPEAPVRPPPARFAPAPFPTAARESAGEFNLGLGILGAVIGAAVGVGLMFGFYEWAGFRFPLLGIGIGVLTGYGARLLYKGTDNTLGIISGGIAMLAVVGALLLMYGTFPPISIISVLVSVSMAYRIAAN